MNELLFNKYFGTPAIIPLHNLCPSKPIFTRPKDGWTGSWLRACHMLDILKVWIPKLLFPSPMHIQFL